MGGKIKKFEAVVGRKMSPESGAGLILIKIFGAAIGAALAQMYLLPKTRQEFVLRAIFSVLVGTIFAWLPMGAFDFPPGAEGAISAACFTAFAAWWAAGAVVRIAETFNGKKG